MLEKLLVKVYDGKPDPEPLRVKLSYTSMGVTLMAVDKNGMGLTCGCLCSITGDGMLNLHGGINPEIEVQRDSNNALVLC